MSSPRHRSLFFISIFWAAALSVLTCLSLPKQFLTADVLMQTVMSLQKLTLYYWGQNRLINVLPLSVSWISDPRANLMAAMLLSSMSFYSLLLMLARFAAAAVNASEINSLALKTFVLVSTAFLVCFTPRAIFEITIAHFEYAMPALFLAIAVHFSVLRTGFSTRSAAASTAAVFLATGLNPATVIPGLFIAAAAVLYRKRVGRAEAFLAGSCLLAYFAWSFVAGLHGDSNYTTFEPAILLAGIGRVIAGLLTALNPVSVLLALGTLALGKTLVFAFGNSADNRASASFENYLLNCGIFFTVAWLLFFSGNRWVQENGFSWRYFTNLFFVALFLLSVSTARIINSLGRWPSYAAAVGAAAISLVTTFVRPTAFEDYDVFRQTRPFTQLGSHLYAGDYWLVWPSVLGDMMQGHEAYGLTFRGEANRDAVRKHVLRMIGREGHASVLCLNQAPEECKRQIDGIAGLFQVSEATPLREKVYEFRLGESSEQLDYTGKAFLDLPSQAGITADGAKKSNGSPGFLVFGPYASLSAGRYRLNVFGTSPAPEGAFVDVASTHGTKVLAKFDLQQGAGNVLLRDADISILVDMPDVEVRVWVSEGTRMDLTGYRLQRR